MRERGSEGEVTKRRKTNAFLSLSSSLTHTNQSFRRFRSTFSDTLRPFSGPNWCHYFAADSDPKLREKLDKVMPIVREKMRAAGSVVVRRSIACI